MLIYLLFVIFLWLLPHLCRLRVCKHFRSLASVNILPAWLLLPVFHSFVSELLALLMCVPSQGDTRPPALEGTGAALGYSAPLGGDFLLVMSCCGVGLETPILAPGGAHLIFTCWLEHWRSMSSEGSMNTQGKGPCPGSVESHPPSLLLKTDPGDPRATPTLRREVNVGSGFAE